ncbi:MAG: hypothetical protein J2P21_00565 [Chloracidobacterium sp.]|nr:hypothetical protein [Chloracidobacterium sp.]
MEPIGHRDNLESGDERVIRFRQPFSAKYTLTITTDILAGYFPIQTKAQIRWALRVINVNKYGQAEIELFTIENRLIETSNPNLNELAALNQAFARMYSEIQVKLDPRGKLLEVVNLPVILSKWEQTKSEMQSIEKESPALRDIIQLNDDIFASPEKVKLAVEHNEFFNLYFHLIYGEELPAAGLRRKHRNLFNSADVSWQYFAEAVPGSPDDDVFTDVEIRGAPIGQMSEEWINAAYGKFELEGHPKLNPRLMEKGEYRFESASGKLLKAMLLKEEIAHTNFLRGKMIYKLKSDDHDE